MNILHKNIQLNLSFQIKKGLICLKISNDTGILYICSNSLIVEYED